MYRMCRCTRRQTKLCLPKLGSHTVGHAWMQESGDDQDDQRRAEKAPGANKGHWKFRSFTKGPNSAFGDTKDTERLRKKTLREGEHCLDRVN